jgi:hypothetical protein
MRNFCLFLFLFLPLLLSAEGRSVVNLKHWQFSRDSIHWQSVTVPHDWAISGPFDKKWDLQMVAIEQNGEKQKTEKSGRSGALPWIGKGYYTTSLYINNVENRHVELELRRCHGGAEGLCQWVSWPGSGLTATRLSRSISHLILLRATTASTSRCRIVRRAAAGIRVPGSIAL